MPEMDGYALVSALREREQKEALPHLPIMVLTADVQMAQRHTYLGHGFDECLLKPVSLGQLRRLLIRWGLLQEPKPGDVAPVPAPKAASSPERPAVDKDAIREQMGALDKNSVEMMNLFTGMTEPLVGKLDQARKDGNDKAIEDTAHSLKGAARSACCPVLGDLAALIQDEAARHRDCNRYIDDLIAEFARVKRAIAELKPD
jgi:CheY-like chemotaxis protein